MGNRRGKRALHRVPLPGHPEPGAARKDPGVGLNLAVTYPGAYRVGAANLGLQAVYSLINARPDALAERAFLPSRGAVRSLESGRPLSSFDVVAFSLPFENDALGIARALLDAGLEPLAAERGPRDPLVLVGGVAATLNPAPLLPLVDAVALGEAEALLPGILDALAPLRRGSRTERVAALADVAGLCLSGAAGRPAVRQIAHDLDAVPVAATVVRCPAAELGELMLVEVARGCIRGCRFCATGYSLRPPRFHSLDSLKPTLQRLARDGGRVGLVGADLADHPQVEQLVDVVERAGGAASPSSLRADGVPRALLERLGRGGLRTLTLAPEAGSETLRRAVNKDVSDDSFIEAAGRAGAAGIRNLKLYVLLGLPGQDEADLEAMADLASRVRRAHEQGTASAFGGSGTVTLSASPFVPKAGTPLQWAEMASPALLRKQGKYLRRRLGRVGGVELTLGSPREAMVQALIARGGAEVGEALAAAARGGVRLEQALRDAGHDPEAIALDERSVAADLPWDNIVRGPEMKHLLAERRRFLEGKPSPECEPETCRRCRCCDE